MISSAGILCYLCIFICTFNLVPAPTINPPNKFQTQKLKTRCEATNHKCKKQPEYAVQQRKTLKNEILVKQLGLNAAKVEEIFKLTFQAKIALHKFAGIDSITPADTGLWANMTLLNKEQAQFLINLYASNTPAANQVSPPQSPPVRPLPRGKRSNGLWLDTFPFRKWKSPIPYYLDQAFSPSEAAAIRSALAKLTASTCITFTELTTTPPKDYMYFVRYNYPWYSCGFSQIGMQDNASYVFVGCFNNGRILHEVMHALGFHHEHQRYDRDNYIIPSYENIAPELVAENIHILAPAQYTSYGTQYDFLSVMHYPLSMKWFSLKPGAGGEQYASLIGNVDDLSQSDIKALNIAYCSPPGCEDTVGPNIQCGWWETLNGFCSRTDGAIELYCRKTCQKCA